MKLKIHKHVEIAHGLSSNHVLTSSRLCIEHHLVCVSSIISSGWESESSRLSGIISPKSTRHFRSFFGLSELALLSHQLGLISDSQNHQKHVEIVTLLSLPMIWILRRVYNVKTGRYDDLLIILSSGHSVIFGVLELELTLDLISGSIWIISTSISSRLGIGIVSSGIGYLVL